MKKKLKILHAAVSMNPSSGVIKQMTWEQNAAHELGIDWECKIHTGVQSSFGIVVAWTGLHKFAIIKYLYLRYNFYKWLISYSCNFDLILLRYSVHDPMQLIIAMKLGRKLLTVHHTKEEFELWDSKKLGSVFKLLIERVFGRLTIRKVLGQVAVTPEILLYQQQRIGSSRRLGIIYPNGIEAPLHKFVDNRSKKTVEIVFVASRFSRWHGLDKIISAVKADQTEFILHVVGTVPVEQHPTFGLDSRIVFHGHLDPEALNEVLARAWCGLSSFSLGKQNMTQACTLKVREYLAAGVPVYAGHVDTGLPENFIFFKNSTPHLKEILAFAREMRSFGREEVYREAQPYIDKGVLLENVYKQILSDYF